MISFQPVMAVGAVYFIKNMYLLFNRVDTKLGLCFTDLQSGDRITLSWDEVRASLEPSNEQKSKPARPARQARKKKV